MLIYKIFRADEYADLVANGETVGAPIDVEDGFVHFSAADQVVETCEKYFAGAEGLKLLAVETAGLGDDLKWEVSRGGAKFPHLFRKLRNSDVIWARDLPLSPDGHEFPADMINPD